MNKQYEHIVRDQSASACYVCNAWNEAYNLSRGQSEYTLPEEAGTGRLRGACGTKGIRILDYNVNFLEPVEIRGISRTPHLDMLFCLGEHMNWELPQSGKEFELFTGESYMGVSKENIRQSIYPALRDIHLVEIKMPLSEIQDMLEDIRSSCNLHCSFPGHIPYGKYRITPSVKVILQQLLSCPYQSSLRQLYIDGKLLELVAVYFSEAVCRTGPADSSAALSKEDMRCICRARELLDENPAEAPSLKALSRYANLNEYKLKRGFKELFGIPVHAYVIQRRMELAKALMDENSTTVSQVAAAVGYSNAAHFAAAFRKKYGVSPGEYLQAVRK